MFTLSTICELPVGAPHKTIYTAQNPQFKGAAIRDLRCPVFPLLIADVIVVQTPSSKSCTPGDFTYTPQVIPQDSLALHEGWVSPSDNRENRRPQIWEMELVFNSRSGELAFPTAPLPFPTDSCTEL